MLFKKFFTLSYDDGVEQDKKLIALLDRFGIKCTFNLNSGFLGQIHSISRVGKDIRHDEIPCDEIQEVYKNHEVATHGVTHADLCKLSRDEIIRQVKTDREKLSELMGYEVKGHAYPFGSYNREVADCLREDCGIEYARTICSTHSFFMPENPLIWHPTCSHHDPQMFSLLDAFLSAKPDKRDLIFCLWGHSYEFDYQTEMDSWAVIEKICNKLAESRQIVYATNGEIIRHIIERPTLND